MWPWCVKMPNQKLLRILLQMLFAEKRVDDSLVQIWKLKLGHKVKFLFILWAEVLVNILKFRQDLRPKFGHYFAGDAWLRFRSLNLVEILKLGLVKILGLKFIGDADVWMLEVDAQFWRWIWSRFVFELVIWPQEVTLIRWTQPSGPLCLWQSFIDVSKLSQSCPKAVSKLSLWCLYGAQVLSMHSNGPVGLPAVLSSAQVLSI